MTTLNLDTLHLDEGSHDTPDRGLCLLEAVAYFAGEDHTDAPACVSPVLAGFGRDINDRLPDALRQELKAFVPRLPGTAGDGRDEARGFLVLDWLVRTYTPTWLDLAGLTAEAAELRGLRRIVDLAAAEAAGPTVRAGAGKARAARAAAWGAAWDAARDAARDAASVAVGAAVGAAVWAAVWDATRDAVADAVADAAWNAAWNAAWAAATTTAGDAAEDALAPTVETLQRSAIDLLDRMITADA